MGTNGTMRRYGSAARFKAEAVSHQMKDRMLEKRLDRASQETERLRLENQLLRDEVEDSRTEHHRILDMLEERMPANRDGNGRTSHKGRWIVFLLALGGGVYAIARRVRENGTEWDARPNATA